MGEIQLRGKHEPEVPPAPEPGVNAKYIYEKGCLVLFMVWC